VAIALRNRWRRQNLPAELRDEVAPKNIIMIGPTGVGKTEIARRLAKLAQAPFLKVEASKYTEVGYVGRDVESMIRDLTELAVTMVKAEMAAAVRERAEGLAEERLLDLLLPRRPGESFVSGTLEEVSPDASRDATRDKLRGQLRAGKLDERPIEMDVQASAGPMFEVFPGQGMEEIGINLKDMLSNLMPGRTRLLVAALQSGEVQTWALSFWQKRDLIMHRDPKIRALARPLLEEPAGEREKIVCTNAARFWRFRF